jgi:hypothetical protein
LRRNSRLLRGENPPFTARERLVRIGNQPVIAGAVGPQSPGLSEQLKEEYQAFRDSDQEYSALGSQLSRQELQGAAGREHDRLTEAGESYGFEPLALVFKEAPRTVLVLGWEDDLTQVGTFFVEGQSVASFRDEPSGFFWS